MITQSTVVIAVSMATTRKAELEILACECCDRTVDASFSCLLDRVTGRPAGVAYVLPEPARCPSCGADVLEHTLVEVRPPLSLLGRSF